MYNFIKTIVIARIEAELENINNVCIEAGRDIDAAINDALNFK